MINPCFCYLCHHLDWSLDSVRSENLVVSSQDFGLQMQEDNPGSLGFGDGHRPNANVTRLMEDGFPLRSTRLCCAAADRLHRRSHFHTSGDQKTLKHKKHEPAEGQRGRRCRCCCCCCFGRLGESTVAVFVMGERGREVIEKFGRERAKHHLLLLSADPNLRETTFSTLMMS